MKILFITQLSKEFLQISNIVNDIVSDMILHGLKEVLVMMLLIFLELGTCTKMKFKKDL